MFLSFVKHGPTRHLDWSVGPTLALLFGAWDHTMNWVSTLLFMFFKPHLFYKNTSHCCGLTCAMVGSTSV